MYLDSFDRAQSAAPTALDKRRSLGGGFVFVSQDDSVAFLAEACIDVLRSAARLTGQANYQWEHIRGEAAIARAGGRLCRPEQTLVLVGGAEAPWRPGTDALTALRSAMLSAARVCVLGGAVFVPLRAGMLAGKRIAVHSAFRPGVEEGPGAPEIVDASTCHHKALSSATGPVAAIRMMADLVGARDGAYTREALARDLGLSEPRATAESGEFWRCTRLAGGDETLCQALEIMRDHLEDTLTVGQIADLLDVSPRKLERGFADLLGQTPLKVYRDLRLERAHQLLTQTTMPVSEVSVACGFSNVTLMKKWFFRKYAVLPCDLRAEAFGGAVTPA
ncbi:MAG: helix-turn-helix domain-containing protein [Roseovarius sp.]